MSQWGEPRTVKGVTVVPHVCTSGFYPATRDSLIEFLYVTDSIRNTGHTACIFEALSNQYEKQPYSTWIEAKENNT